MGGSFKNSYAEGELKVLLALAAVLAGAVVAPAPACSQPPPTPVAVARTTVMDLAAGQSFVGTVLPARVSDVGSAVDGRLTALPIADGQQVREGEPIAELLRGLLEIEREGTVAELQREVPRGWTVTSPAPFRVLATRQSRSTAGV